MPPSYMPPLFMRVRELLRAVQRVWNPPPFGTWQDGDVLIVCDPIEAYRSLFAPVTLRTVRTAVCTARDAGVPVVVTRWVRDTATDLDAVDAKGHWSYYVPRGQSRVLPDALAGGVPDTLADVVHPNAFSNTGVREVTAKARRVVLAGTWTESCVIQTARGALEHNLHVSVLADACVGHVGVAWWALLQIQLLLGEVVAFV